MITKEKQQKIVSIIYFTISMTLFLLGFLLCCRVDERLGYALACMVWGIVFARKSENLIIKNK